MTKGGDIFPINAKCKIFVNMYVNLFYFWILSYVNTFSENKFVLYLHYKRKRRHNTLKRKQLQIMNNRKFYNKSSYYFKKNTAIYQGNTIIKRYFAYITLKFLLVRYWL